jgi:hypothetical protein
MNEPTKENPKTSKRSKRRPAMEPLGWDEIISQPGMGGYLSFLNGPVPLPHLSGTGLPACPSPVPPPSPGVVSDPRIGTTSEVTSGPELIPTLAPHPFAPPGVASYPGTVSQPDSLRSVAPDPVVVTAPRIDIAPEVTPSPGLASTPGDFAPPPGVVSDPGLDASIPEWTQTPATDPATSPGVVSHSGIDSPSTQTFPVASAPGVITAPGIVTEPRVKAIPVPEHTPLVTKHLGFVRSIPEVVLIPAVLPGPRLRIRKCGATHDGHSLGEEVLYQALWKAAHAESAKTRTIVIGWRGMSQLCRMTPKNCKINTQRLIRKLALEVLSPYNTPESIGTTYRVYSDEAILQRRREAGLEWVVRSRGVEFVDPATGISILPICAHTYQSEPPLT